MSKRLKLGAYWKARRESVEQCAGRLFAFMGDLTECDKVFSHWYGLGRSRKDALKREIEVHSRHSILALLDKARNRNFHKEVIEDLGFHPCVWNGGESDKEASLSVTCGLYCEAPGLGGNSVILEFPEQLGELSSQANASRVLSLTASCWEPDWAGIFSNEAMNARDWERKPFVDWMVYVPRKIANVPLPSTVMHLENGGSLIVVQPNPPSVGNPEEQERIHTIEAIVRG